tara:strand:+ start:493 stop:2475 length:1983 start_codon:yes stop_codon:yes gene_type:complete
MATKKLVPRANNEGGIGTSAKTWGASWLQNLTLTGLATDASLTSILVEDSGLIKKRPLSGLTMTVADTDDTTCYVGLWEDATGNLQPKTDEVFKFNAHDGSQALYVPRIYGNTNTTSAASDLRLQAESAINGGPTDAAGGFVTIHGSSGTGAGASGGVKIYGTRPTTSGTGGHTAGYIALFDNRSAAHSEMTIWDPASVSPTDYFRISVTASGETTLQTIDVAGGDADLDIKADGDVLLHAQAGNTTFHSEGSNDFFWMGGGNVSDYLQLRIGSEGQALWTTIDAAGSDAYMHFEADGYMHFKPFSKQIWVGSPDNTLDLIARRTAPSGVAGGALQVSAGSITGVTDKPGGILYLTAGAGTGAATLSSVMMTVYKTGSSGSTAQTGYVGSALSTGSLGTTTQWTLFSQDGGGDQFETEVSGNGATELRTVDAAGMTAHLTLNVDGNIELNADTGQIQFKDDSQLNAELDVNGQFSSLNYRTMYIDAGAMAPSVTSGAALGSVESSTNKVINDYLAFDKDSDEYAQFKLVMPAEWDPSTAIKAKFYWMPKSSTTTTHDVTWGIQATAHADGGTVDSSWGTGVTVSDAVLGTAAARVHITAATGGMTVAGSPAAHADELVYFRVYRDVDGAGTAANDDLNEDAYLLGVMIQYKEIITHDAAW